VKLTDKQFGYFKERCEYWRMVLGLNSLHMFVGKEKLEDCNACVILDKENGLMSVFIGDPIDKEVSSDEALDRIAFHEVFEGGYLYDLETLASYGYARERVHEAAHNTVRMAENTIFKYLRGY
jgi:hypothetical protein